MATSLNPSMRPQEAIKKELDRCVMCGLCSEHCPTYKITGIEAESPRGRLALMSGLWNNDLEAESSLLQHLDHCLGCRACEAVCPSQVNYGHILDQTRAQLNIHPGKNNNEMPLRTINLLTQGGYSIRFLFTLLRFAQHLKLPSLARKTGLLRAFKLERLERYLPPPQHRPRWQSVYYPKNKPCGRVGLFLGCIAQEIDALTLFAGIRLLTKLGYEVHILSSQSCCGALHLHTGHPVYADKLTQNNYNSFVKSGIQTILSITSACTVTLSESLDILSKKEANSNNAFHIRDINHFLLMENKLTSDHFAPLAQHIAIHDPCSLRNVLKQQHAAYELLRLIPEAKLSELADNQYCCGAAGTHMMTHPAEADLLRKPKLRALDNVQIIATSNIGCALHLAAGLQTFDNQIEVLHPITILERQLRL